MKTTWQDWPWDYILAFSIIIAFAVLMTLWADGVFSPKNHKKCDCGTICTMQSNCGLEECEHGTR